MMASCSASCPHLSLPVEMDEMMTSSLLNLVWPECQKCSVHVDGTTPPSNDLKLNDSSALERARAKALMDVEGPPSGASQNFLEMELPSRYFEAGNCCWNIPSEDEESLEKPLPLRSDVGESQPRIPWPGPPRCPPNAVDPQCHRCMPERPHMLPPHTDQRHTQARLEPPRPVVPMATPQDTARVRDTPDLMSEVCVPRSQPIRASQEVKRTISLPDDCRTVFITYSVDVAEEIFPFVTFLINQGFRPAIDIFDNAVRQMNVNKWMDSYLKDKSVLIIMVISPKYKVDIEGDGSDQHGLHTKYIHSQLQNEFIQQHCLNFRLVPVLFPSANQSHIPPWLQSTRVFRWPRDAQDLLLRLLREERYIAPPLGRDLTVSIRPL